MKILITESQLFFIIKEQRGGSNKMDTEKFVEKSKFIHKDENGNPKYDYSLVDYVDSDTKVKVICPKHIEQWKNETGENFFLIRPSKHLQGQGCKFDYLESKIKYSDQDLSNEASKYKTTAEFKKNAPLYFNAANKRGRDFYEKLTSHFIPEKESSGEKLIAKILVDNGLIDKKCITSKKCENREKTFKGCVNTKEGRYCRPLKFDFYLPEINTVIEYDGEQHFNPSTKFGGDKFDTTKENDRIKDAYCEKHGIKLIRIHYKFPVDNLENSIMGALKSSNKYNLIGNY